MFELTDAEREGVGLDPIDPAWRRVEIGTISAFFDGTTLRKYLTADLSGSNERGYLEIDTERATRDDCVLLPKTAKGKAKKLTPAVLLDEVRSGGRRFEATFPTRAGLRTSIDALNMRNMRRLYFWNFADVSDYDGLRRNLAERAATLDDEARADIAAMKSAPRQNVKYKPGDIFRFRIGYDRFGFGFIIGCLIDIRRWNVLAADHSLNSIMTVPLIVRAFRYGGLSSQPDLARLAEAPLLPAQLMMDCQIFWGDYPIVGHKTLEARDVDFPMGYGISPSPGVPSYFYWGFGQHRNVPTADASVARLSGRSIAYFRPSVVMTALDGGAEVDRDDLRHPDHAAIRARLFEAIGYNGPEDYASYAAWAGCLGSDDFVARTRAHYDRPRGTRKR